MKKVGFVSLGCPKNLVDSEVMMGQLKQSGYEITADAADAETVVVNTCGFIDSAKKESIEAILEAARLKTEGHAKRLVVAGCLVERYRDELKAEMPEVDAFIGTNQINDGGPPGVGCWTPGGQPYIATGVTVQGNYGSGQRACACH